MAYIEDYLLQIEQEIQDGRKSIFGGNVTVNAEVIMNAVNGIRESLPPMIREARQIVDNAARITDESYAKAKQIMAEAKRKADAMISDTEIRSVANREADAIKAQAIEYQDKIHEVVRNDVDVVLGSVESSLVEALDIIRHAKDNNR